MKTSIYFICFTAALISLNSCSSTTNYYYQFYKTQPASGITLNDNIFSYEDENCIVTYDLWKNGGDIGFIFHNKTNKVIYLNLEHSFLISNGIASSYFRNRTYTSSTTTGGSSSKTASGSKAVTGINVYDQIQTNNLNATAGVEVMHTSGSSITSHEDRIVRIPPKSAKIITEFKINETLYRDCELLRYPSKNNIKTKRFSASESPIQFKNFISYSTSEKGELISFENAFYVSEITNYPSNEMIGDKLTEFCGEKSIYKTSYFKKRSHDSFYLRYTQSYNTYDFKH